MLIKNNCRVLEWGAFVGEGLKATAACLGFQLGCTSAVTWRSNEILRKLVSPTKCARAWLRSESQFHSFKWEISLSKGGTFFKDRLRSVGGFVIIEIRIRRASDYPVLGTSNPDIPRAISRAENYCFAFSVCPHLPLKGLFINSRVESPVNKSPFSASCHLVSTRKVRTFINCWYSNGMLQHLLANEL